ncbi:MAG TPA: carboxypeptidase regulatory-like domain-containing protein, partial [Tepidisphaeraceae bacterium]|nr:carboxypeptidase regulatory-like domain-containing protein [Tepidisphaeraceae bacterium]
IGCFVAHWAHAQQEPKPTTASTAVLFSGQVLNSQGKPAADASVKAFSINRDDIKLIESTRTDSDGRFEIHHNPHTSIGLVIQGADHQMACLRDAVGTRGVQIKLHPAAELLVNLVDVSGKPMRGLHISLAKPRGGGFENTQYPYEGVETQTWTTDDKGLAHIKPVPLGSSVTLQLDDAQFARLPLSVSMVAIGQPITKTDPIGVGPASSIEGRVIASGTNEPIAGISVSADFRDGGTSFQADAPTTASGEFHISRLPAGTFDIRVFPNHEQSKTWLSATKAVTTAPGRDLEGQTLSLSHGAEIVGKILESGTDRPLANASVEARTLQARNRIYLGNSNAKGEYALRLPPGTYRLNINAARVMGNFDPTVSMGETTVEDGKTYTRDFALTSKSPEAAARSITGHVVDQQGRPVARASIVVWNHSEAGSFVHPTASRSDGSFSISNAPDHVTLRAFAPTAKAATAEPIEVAAGKDIVLHLAPWPTVHGRVVDSDGKPLSGAVIAIAIEIESRAFVFYTVGPTIQTDEKGQYEAPVPLPGLRYMVYATETGLAAHRSAYMPALKAGESRAEPDMVLKKADSFVAGRVVDEQGRGVANVAVRTSGSDSPGQGAGTDADGNFRIVHIADAEYELSAYRAPSERGSIHAKAGTSDNVLTLHPATQPARSAP